MVECKNHLKLSLSNEDFTDIVVQLDVKEVSCYKKDAGYAFMGKLRVRAPSDLSYCIAYLVLQGSEDS